jgi:hypothetical protein
MAEPITCPGCGEALDLAAEHVGRRVRCPVCGHEFAAPVPDTGVVPVARPVRKRRRDPDDEDAELVADARRRVAGPASWLRVVGGLYVIAGMFGLALAVMLGMEAADNPAAARQALNAQNDEDVAVLVGMVGCCSLFGVACGGMMMYGAGKMARLESAGWGTAAAALAIGSLLFCTCGLVLGVPVGIWALVVLNDPDVRDAFRVAADRRRDGERYRSDFRD